MRFVITGANRGIGRGILELALAEGHDVVAVTRRPQELKDLSKSYGKKLSFEKCDVTQQADLKKVAARISKKPVDVLINNAGTYSKTDFGKLTTKEFEQSFLVNTIAPVLFTQSLMKALEKSSLPLVVNITSLMGSIEDNTSGGSYIYRMSKSALNMFHQCLTLEYPRLFTLLLHPGWVKTRMGGSSAPTELEDSVRGLFQIITERKSEHRGKFLNFKGEELPW